MKSSQFIDIETIFPYTIAKLNSMEVAQLYRPEVRKSYLIQLKNLLCKSEMLKHSGDVSGKGR